MKISEVKYSEISLPFLVPLRTSGHTLKERVIFLIRLKDESGNYGYGESAPLPSFGNETLTDAIDSIGSLKKLSGSGELNIYSPFEEKVEWRETLSPSVKFAVDQAVLSLNIKNNGDYLKERLKLPGSGKININGLIGISSPDETAASIKHLLKKGYKTIKVKIGRADFREDIDCIETIRSIVDKNVKLRLDVNGVWTLEEAMARVKILKEFDIEYVEDPLEDPEDLRRLTEISDIPIAIDKIPNELESFESYLNGSGVKYFILKPMLYGGLKEFKRLMSLTEEKNIEMVISSVFESGIGRSFLILMAFVLNSQTAHGIGTAGFLRDEPAEDPYSVKGGKIDFRLDNYPPDFITHYDFNSPK